MYWPSSIFIFFTCFSLSTNIIDRNGYIVQFEEKKNCLWVSEWVIVVSANSNNFSAISWWEQFHFQWDNDKVRFILEQHALLDFYSASCLKQQSGGRHVAPLRHIILIPSQPVFALSPYAACLAEKQQFHSLWFDPIGARTHNLLHSRR